MSTSTAVDVNQDRSLESPKELVSNAVKATSFFQSTTAETDAASPRAHPPPAAETYVSPYTSKKVQTTDAEETTGDGNESPTRPSKRTASGSAKTPTNSQPASPTKAVSNSPLADKEKMQEISLNLRKRLSYAMLKVQNGWTSQSIDEIEQTVKNTSPRGSPLKSPKPDYPQKLTAPQPVTTTSQLLSMSQDSPRITATHVVIDEDEHGRLSTTTSMTTVDSSGSPGQSRDSIEVVKHDKTYESFWLNHTPQDANAPHIQLLKPRPILQFAKPKPTYTTLKFQPPLSADPNYDAPVPIIVKRQKTPPPRKAAPAISDGGFPITANGLPALGTFSNKVPPALNNRTSTSPSPSSRRKSKSSYNKVRSDSLSNVTGVAVVAAAAAAAAELEKEEAIRTEPASRQRSEVDAIESLIFLSSPTGRSWNESERAR
ncbi:hypothetical protein V1512DRAFT_211862 [Lipomyces arxii]|uniref:uncharacterized protein n=1 Tax=Lipomyces arxii TaxID=56418 RepID=UPI0034CE8B7A